MRLLSFHVLLWSLLTVPSISVAATGAIRDRLREAEREVALAEASHRRASARLETLQQDPQATTEQLLAAETVVFELSELINVRQETLWDLQAMAGETVTAPDPTVTAGMEAFEEAVREIEDAEEPETEQERLEKEFAASLEEFDGMILDHQLKVEDRMAERSAEGEAKASTHRSAAAEAEALLASMGVETGNGEGNGEDGGSPSDSTASGEPSEAGEDAQVAGSTSGNTAGASGSTTGGSGRRAAREDEDVVARQLREAAEKETDPVLREKLWKEYEAYLDGRS